jgi:hypothetical protein
MNTPIKPLARFDYEDVVKDLPLRCQCGVAAPGEFVEYYRLYHVLVCMKCRTPLAVVEHPVPVAPRRTAKLLNRREEPQALVA